MLDRPPAPWHGAKMPKPLEVSAEIEVGASPAATFALAAGGRLAEFIKPNGPLPGVAKVEGAADWSAPGETRRLTLTDGASLHEELTGIARNKSFSYRATGFTGPFGALVAEGRGDWRFESDAPGRTKVVWTYAFTPKGPISAPALALIVKALWPAYMRAALGRLKALAERQGANAEIRA